MNNVDFLKYVSNELKNNRNVDFEYKINDITYKIKFLPSNSNKGINIPSIIAIPLLEKINNQIIVESNNLESDNFEEIVEQGALTGLRLARLTKEYPGPIVIPLIPSHRNYPYFQQLSKECFNIPSDNKNYRMDEQVVRIIDNAKSIIEKETGLIVQDKIFLNGYSSSGVFAQRFALLHPEIIETACIGGASGSIPIPTEKISYPIGIADYEFLTGKKFDYENYSKIHFKYYVGEFETKNKSHTRFDELGNPAPMHDMSYFNRSVPMDVGKVQRNLLGNEMFYRIENTIKILQNLEIDIQHEIILGRGHNNINGIGVNELGEKNIIESYRNSLDNKNEKTL